MYRRQMQPNVIVAESIGHRARFVWLGLALAATIALLVIPAVMRDAPRAHRSEPTMLDRSMYRVHRCHEWRKSAQLDAKRAELRARFEAERAERLARRAAERAERQAERAERAIERAAEQAERAVERAERLRFRHHRHRHHYDLYE
jgi:hypothetical protein